jgi:hypoxanthine phosphoribosyltransferase
MIHKLYLKIKKHKFDTILTIHRGGFIPAVYLSHLTNIRDVDIIYVQHSEIDEIKPEWKKTIAFDDKGFIAKNKHILLIDDIVGTGKTINIGLEGLLLVLFVLIVG